MRLTEAQKIAVAFFIGGLIMYAVMRTSSRANLMAAGAAAEGFQGTSSQPNCSECGSSWPCGDHSGGGAAGSPVCPPMPDMSKYVLKSSIPPCATCPDLSNYMLKTECPPVPDMSQYVLKSSIPKQGPIIVDASAALKDKCGECPPCPRPRCPEIKCPPPAVCPACPPCARTACPETTVKCRAEESAKQPVRPYLAPMSSGFFG